MNTPTQAITDLQAQWHTLQDLDRAEAVSTIHQAGVSFRHLAKALNCSESLLRHLLHAREASPVDLALARLGQISTWELARRSVAIRTGRASVTREDSEIEMANVAKRGCSAIRGWLGEQNLDNPYGVQVTREACQLLVNAEKAGKLPCGQAPSGFTTDEIIRRCQPAEPKTQNAEVVSWYARWLAIWTCYVIPNARVRQQTLLLSIETGSVAH
jgi:lambda repressor-like predicted transcriptional regulator